MNDLQGKQKFLITLKAFTDVKLDQLNPFPHNDTF